MSIAKGLTNKMHNKKYLMESPKETIRLRAKVDPDLFVSTYLKKYLDALLLKNKKKVIRILDLGCGSGVISSSIAQMYPKLIVYGADLNSKRYEEEARSGIKNLFFIQANAYKLPFKSNSFDLIFTRFMLEYMKRPVDVVGEMRRLAKIGARVIVQDLDGQLVSNYPVSRSFDECCNKVVAQLAFSGFDPYIGRKLYSFFKLNGLKQLGVIIEPYHLYAGRIDPVNYKLWKTKLEIAFPHIKKALGSDVRARGFVKTYMRYLQSNETFSFSTIFTVTGIK